MAGINVNGIGRNPYADSYLTSANLERNMLNELCSKHSSHIQDCFSFFQKLLP